MHCSVTTTLTYTTSWRKQHEAPNMLPPLSPSNEQRMVVVHGWPLPANMLGKTSGRPRSRNKSNCYIPIYGTARVTSHSNTLSPNTAMHMYQCQHVQNMFNTDCPTNTHALFFLLMHSNVPMRPQWPALKQTMVCMACEIILNELQQTCYHMTE